jgi:hypothetical protein
MESKLYNALQEGEPVAQYRKTVPSQVCVKRINAFTGLVEEIILSGDGKNAIVSLWTPAEEKFFREMNESHLSKGTLAPYTPPEVEPEKTLEDATDEEITEMVNSRFLKLSKSVLNQTVSEEFVNKLLLKAKELEKSDKIIAAIETRLAEIQNMAMES